MNLNHSPLARSFMFTSRPLQKLGMKSFDKCQSKRPAYFELVYSYLHCISIINNFPYIILSIDRGNNTDILTQDFIKCCDSSFDHVGTLCFLQKPCQPKQVSLGRGLLHHAIKIRQESYRLTLKHAKTAPIVLAGGEGKRREETRRRGRHTPSLGKCNLDPS